VNLCPSVVEVQISGVKRLKAGKTFSASQLEAALTQEISVKTILDEKR
jgi:hypothetical protein